MHLGRTLPQRATQGAKPGGDASATEGSPLQTLLFSATMPAWVKDITRRFLRKGHKLVDLVGDSKIKVCMCMGACTCVCGCGGRVGGLAEGRRV